MCVIAGCRDHPPNEKGARRNLAPDHSASFGSSCEICALSLHDPKTGITSREEKKGDMDPKLAVFGPTRPRWRFFIRNRRRRRRRDEAFCSNFADDEHLQPFISDSSPINPAFRRKFVFVIPPRCDRQRHQFTKRTINLLFCALCEKRHVVVVGRQDVNVGVLTFIL